MPGNHCPVLVNKAQNSANQITFHATFKTWRKSRSRACWGFHRPWEYRQWMFSKKSYKQLQTFICGNICPNLHQLQFGGRGLVCKLHGVYNVFSLDLTPLCGWLIHWMRWDRETRPLTIRLFQLSSSFFAKLSPFLQFFRFLSGSYQQCCYPEKFKLGKAS